MMLTNSTAKAMGSNRTDPAQSIEGGAKNYDQILTIMRIFPSLTVTGMHWLPTIWDRVQVNQIQKRIQARCKDPNNWLNIYLEQNKAKEWPLPSTRLTVCDNVSVLILNTLIQPQLVNI